MLESKSKLYYSIKEVSEITDLKPYVLRYWETEFPSLKPIKNKVIIKTIIVASITLFSKSLTCVMIFSDSS